MGQKIAIVDEGEYGWVSRRQGDYRGWNDALLNAFRDPTFEVSVIKKTEAALEWLSGAGVLVFTTRGMIEAAEHAAGRFPGIRVVVFSALPPSSDGRVVVHNKDVLIEGVDTIRRAVLG